MYAIRSYYVYASPQFIRTWVFSSFLRKWLSRSSWSFRSRNFLCLMALAVAMAKGSRTEVMSSTCSLLNRFLPLARNASRPRSCSSILSGRMISENPLFFKRWNISNNGLHKHSLYFFNNTYSVRESIQIPGNTLNSVIIPNSPYGYDDFSLSYNFV